MRQFGKHMLTRSFTAPDPKLKFRNDESGRRLSIAQGEYSRLRSHADATATNARTPTLPPQENAWRRYATRMGRDTGACGRRHLHPAARLERLLVSGCPARGPK